MKKTSKPTINTVTLKAGTRLIFDLGFLNYPIFDQLTEQGVSPLSRVKKNTAYEIDQVLQRSATIHDQIIRLASSKASSCTHLLRLVEILYHGTWYRYGTNVVDPQALPPTYAMALYWQRWRVEDAFNAIKRLLGLAYFWVGSINGMKVSLGNVVVVCGVGGPDRRRGRRTAPPIQGGVDGNGVSRALPLHPSAPAPAGG